MAEYINANDLEDFRNDLMEKFISLCNYNDYRKITLLTIGDTVDRIYAKYCYKPLPDVAEVRHGEWIPIVIQESYFDPPYCDTCKCSMCEFEIDVSETVYNYCPNCGAKMDGGGDGNDRP